MNRHISWPAGAALAALLLSFMVSSAPAKVAGPTQTADRPGVYNTGGFTFGNTQQLNPTLLTGFSLEPEIKTDLHSNVYVTAMEGVPGGVDLWKSTNRGTSFTYLGTPDGAVCPTPPTCVNGIGLGGGDDSIDVSNGGYLYVSSLWLGSTTISVSKDGGTGGALPGQAWEVNPIAGQPPALDRQWVAAYGPETLYQSYTDIGTGTVWVEKSVDAGDTFGAPVPVYPVMGRTIESFRMGNLVVDPYNGNVYLAFVSDATLGHTRAEVWLGKSTDGGASWSLTKAYQGPAGTNAAHSFPITAVDRGGNVHIAFARCDVNVDDRSNCQIWLVSSADQGATWLDAVRVSNGSNTQGAVFPYIAAGSPGVVDVTWYGSSNPDPDANSSQDWHVFLAQTRDALSATPTFNQVQHPQQMHDSSICFRGLDCDIGTPGNRDLAEYYSLTVDPDGNANIAFSDSVTNCPSSSCTVTTWYTKQASGPSVYAPPAPPATATFAAPIDLPGMTGAAEPSVWVDSHNCIYATGIGGAFARSEDNGATWQTNTQPPALLGGDEDVTTIPKQDGTRNDTLYYTDLVAADVDIFKSTNRGVTWAGTTEPYGHMNFSSDRQWLYGDRINGGVDQMLYEMDHELASEVIRFAASANDSAWTPANGLTDPELLVGPNMTLPNTNPGPVFVSKPTHRVHGVFAISSARENLSDPPFGKEPNVWEADSAAAVPNPPGPPTWPAEGFVNHPVFKGVIDSPPAPAIPAAATTYGSHTAAIFPSGDADAAGNIYVVWSTNSTRADQPLPSSATGTTWSIWFAASHDGGKNYYGPFRVSSGVGTSIFPWISAGDAGKVDIVWYQSSNSAPPQVADPSTPGRLTGGPTDMPAGSTWFVKMAQSVNAASREPVFSQNQVSPDPHHVGSISTGGTTGLTDDRTLLDYFEVKAGPDGLANVVWADNGLQSLRVKYGRQLGGVAIKSPPAVLGCASDQPTAATLSSIEAKQAGSRGVRIVWRTATELKTLGFNVSRAKGKSYRKLNAALISSRSTFGVGGHKYEYLDRGAVAAGSYSYKLELVKTDGSRLWIGPIKATVRARLRAR